MNRIWAASVCIGSLIVGTVEAHAEVSRTEALAQQWRASRLADLQAERARIDAEIAALPAAPSLLASPVLPVVAGPAAQPAPLQMARADAPLARVGAEAQNDDAPAPAPALAQEVAAPDSEVGPQDGRQTFGGLDLGVGLSFTFDVGKLDRISRASVVNGIVRSDDQDNGKARIMLESHYFFTPCTWNFLGLKNPCMRKKSDNVNGEENFEDNYFVADPKKARWGMGPFIAIQPGSENIIDAIGLGLMIGARREQSEQSFNLGIGVVFDPNTQVLGDGIIENQPLPNGETEVRYRETLQTGVLVLTSFSF